MSSTKFGLMRAKEIGLFDQSNEFVGAQADMLYEMRTAYTDWKEQYNDGHQRANMGNTLDYFNEIQNPGSKIYASFLGRVAMELENLLGDWQAVRKLEVMTYEPELNSLSIGSERLHRDNFEKDAVIGIRYLVANRNPTVIPELGKTQPGTIYRTSNKYTLHKRPQYPHIVTRPRTLLVVNA